MISQDDKSEIVQIIRDILAHGITDKKVCDTPLEFYDVVNKGFVYAAASGVMSDTTVATNPTPTLIPIASATFADGITPIIGGGFKIVTAGKYLVIGSAYFNAPNTTTVYQAEIFVNGVSVIVNSTFGQTGGREITPTAIGILNLNAGDNVQLYGATGANFLTNTVMGASSYLALCKI